MRNYNLEERQEYFTDKNGVVNLGKLENCSNLEIAL